jgi:hypothetical protein
VIAMQIQISVLSLKFHAVHPTYPVEYFGGFKVLERICLGIYVLFHSRRIHLIFLAVRGVIAIDEGENVKSAAETVNSSMGCAVCSE